MCYFIDNTGQLNVSFFKEMCSDKIVVSVALKLASQYSGLIR